MSFLETPIDVAEQVEGLAKQFRPLFREQFKGLAPGTRHLNDAEFVRWFDAESAKRPNMVQMLAMQGSEGHKELRRYAKATGREGIIEFVIGMFARDTDG